MEQRETAISLWSRRVMEACWLLALAIIPVYFSLLSDRHFEPDKATVLRSLVLVLGGAWIVYILERGQVFRAWPKWRLWARAPLVIPALVYSGVFLLTTLTSILVWTSFWGGYNRLQGFYTNLSYIVVFGAIICNVRRREQIERIITVMIATAVPALLYGLLQHQKLDPLPWAGDTAARVASTMGNSIFVAAYLILVLPFMLYRSIASIYSIMHSDSFLYADRDDVVEDHKPSHGVAWVDGLWMGAYAILAFAQIALLYGVLKLGAILQGPITEFPSYWYIFPMASIVVGSTFLLYTYTITTKEGRGDWRTYLPGILVFLMFTSLFLGGYLTMDSCPTSGVLTDNCINTRLSTFDRASDFGLWIAFGALGFLIFYGLVLFLPRRTRSEASPLMNIVGSLVYGSLAIFTIIIVFYTQSRGPQIGMFISIFTFITLVLVQAWRTWRKKMYLGLISIWIVLTLLGAGFLVLLNTTDSFAGLRQSPYIARLGNLLETEGGTGKVRIIIWRGDAVTRGAVDLILTNPLRTVIGWGPETMFMAYNPFYPPELANYESRGASPDRSHQALLDELVTKGALGLFSHLFLFGSFAILMMRLLQVRRAINIALTLLFMLGIAVFFTIFLKNIVLGIIAGVAGIVAVGLAAWLGYATPLRRPMHFGWQLMAIAAIASVVANFVENIFGIPIVSSLLYTWVIMGFGVVVGAFAGVYHLGHAAPEPVAEPEGLQEETPSAATRKQRQRTAQRQTANRTRSRPAQGSAPARLVYPLVGLLSLIGIWFFNLDGIYADMRFMQSKQLLEQAGSIEAHVLSYAALDDAIDASPHEDLYYLSMGRVFMTLATDVSVQQQQLIQNNPSSGLAAVTNRQPNPNATLENLPEIPYSQEGINSGVQEFVTKFGPLELLDYARLSLEEAQKLNPGNKDHPANLGRLHASWFRNIQLTDPVNAQKHLELAIKHYEEAHLIAPQDVELTGQWAMLYLYANQGQRTEEILQEALTLDPSYTLNISRMAEAKRRQGDLAGAAEFFAKAVQREPQPWNALLDIAELPAERQARINQTKQQILGDDVLFEKLKASYTTVIQEQPANLPYRQGYVQILSDTMRYDLALQEVDAALAVGKAQPKPNDRVIQALEAIAAYLRSVQNGG